MRDYVTLTGPEAANVAYTPTVDDEGVVGLPASTLFGHGAAIELNPRVWRMSRHERPPGGGRSAWGPPPETDAAATRERNPRIERNRFAVEGVEPDRLAVRCRRARSLVSASLPRRLTRFHPRECCVESMASVHCRLHSERRTSWASSAIAWTRSSHPGYSYNHPRVLCALRPQLRPPLHAAPDQLTLEHIRQYQLHLTRERHVAWTYFNQVVCALRFFYREVLKADWEVRRIPYQKTGRKLPEIHEPRGGSPPSSRRPATSSTGPCS